MNLHAVTYEDLLSFAAGELTGPAASRVQAHFETCLDCTVTIACYQAIRRELGTPMMIEPPVATLERAKALFDHVGSRPVTAPSIGDHARRIVASLTFDSRGSFALSGVRGAPAAGYQVMFESDEVEIDLQIEPDPVGGPGGWQLMGQIGMDEALGPIPIRLVLAGSEVPVVESETDEYGVFSFRAGSGRYDLHIGLPAATVVVPDLEV